MRFSGGELLRNEEVLSWCNGRIAACLVGNRLRSVVGDKDAILPTRPPGLEFGNAAMADCLLLI